MVTEQLRDVHAPTQSVPVWDKGECGVQKQRVVLFTRNNDDNNNGKYYKNYYIVGAVLIN